ncbi:protein S100-B isoform X1 [Echeneis naucrates]|uniref:protein S100-B isoform X1 n=1 Tax=Echeneis naucrates TaxID=173247 RepID=UPI0011145DA3|nr:protein S100-B isoform X1 [Echeneis naucrates]
MEPHTTPSPAPPILEEKLPAGTEDVIHSNSGALAAIIGGVVGGILLVFICVLALLLWCLSRQKGSYVTNEMDDDDDIVNHEDGDGDEDEFVSSDVEPVKVKEED